MIKHTSRTHPANKLHNTLATVCREGIAIRGKNVSFEPLLYFANLSKMLDTRGTLVYNVG